MKKYFVTGTDTSVGKTLISAILQLTLQAHYWKPIQSGDSDLQQVRELTGLSDENFSPSVYSFKASLAPHQAAALESIAIDLTQCKLPCRQESLIVEGAGGVYVPLTETEVMLDLMRQLALPIVIVSRGTLGTINHTLLTIEALRQRNLNIHGIVFCGELDKENQKAIEKWGNVKTLFHVPYFESISPQQLQQWVKDHKETILEAVQ